MTGACGRVDGPWASMCGNLFQGDYLQRHPGLVVILVVVALVLLLGLDNGVKP